MKREAPADIECNCNNGELHSTLKWKDTPTKIILANTLKYSNIGFDSIKKLYHFQFVYN